MTALMAALGLVPLALGLGPPRPRDRSANGDRRAGRPATATFLNLVVLPEAVIRMQGWLGLGKGGGDATPKLAKPARRPETASAS